MKGSNTFNILQKMAACRVFIFFSVALSHLMSNGLIVGGIRIPGVSPVGHHQGEDDGDDMIDCVDIYKQPAFSHPLLKNHTIQMRPSSYPSGIKARTKEAESLPSLFQYGRCPEGTIPISRRKVDNQRRPAPSFLHKMNRLNHSFLDAGPSAHEHAVVSLSGGTYFGANAEINVWSPFVANSGEFSLAQIWVLAGVNNQLNSIEAGWQVTSSDEKPHFFIYWTRDGYQETGCYNIQCPGFVQTSRNFAFGQGDGPFIAPVSHYGGNQQQITITIHQDLKTGNWWLQLNNQEIGYWPKALFTTLAKSSDTIQWGGEIVNTRPDGHHTATRMGSGHFSREGWRKASFFRQIRSADGSLAYHDALNVVPIATNPSCYDVNVVNDKVSGINFYFGGPGYSDSCK